MLSLEQQRVVESLIPHANKIVNKLRPGDEEASGIAYLALCEAVMRYKPGAASIKTYSLRCVKRELQNNMGSRAGKRKKSDARFLSLPGEVSTADESLQWVEIEDLLRVLRPSDREIFRKVVFDEVPISVVAMQRGCSRQAIYNIMNRCKERLRREIDGDSSNTSRRM